jgi:hypothetical protein
VIRRRVRALLLRPRDVAVGLPREEVEAIDEIVEAAAGEGVQIIDWEVPIAEERLEDALDVALGDRGEFGCAAPVEDRCMIPTGVALPGHRRPHGGHLPAAT